MKNNEVIPDTIELSSQLINALRGLTNPKQIEDLINQGALLELKKLTPQSGIPNNPLTILVSNYFPHNNQIDTFNTVFKLLVDKGEDINDTIHQTTLLSLCIQKKLDEAVNILLGLPQININPNTPTTPIMEAISLNNLGLVKTLLDKGAEVNPSNPNYNSTPLIVAIQSNNSELINLMLEKGANIEPEGDNLYTTPLIAATEQGNLELCKLLLTKGALIEPQLQTIHQSPLENAARVGNLELVKLLVDKGGAVNPNREDSHTTPLLEAARSGKEDIVEYLISKGADLKQKITSLQDTPFVAGFSNSHETLAKKIFEKGIDIKNQFELAYRQDNPKLVQFLTSLGAQKDTNIEYAPYWIQSIQDISEYIPSISFVKNIFNDPQSMLNPNRFKKFFTSEGEKAVFLAKLRSDLENYTSDAKFYAEKKLLNDIKRDESTVKKIEKNIQECEQETEKLVKLRDEYQEQRIENEIRLLSKKINYFTSTGQGGRTAEKNKLKLAEYQEAALNKKNPASYVKELNSQIDEITAKIDKGKNKVNELNTKIFYTIKSVADDQTVGRVTEHLESIISYAQEKLLNPDCFLYETLPGAKSIKATIHVPGHDLNEAPDTRPLDHVNNDLTHKEKLSKPTKVLIIDGFTKSKDDKITSSSLQNPKLDSKLSEDAKAKKLLSDNHSTFVAGVITSITDNVEFDIMDHLSISQIAEENTKVVNLSIGFKELSEIQKIFSPKLLDMAQEELTAFLYNNAKNCIFVKALGNESKTNHETALLEDIESGPYNLKDKVLFVVNVIHDGITISPSSSIPGNDALLQRLTVAAPGTDVWSTITVPSIEELRSSSPEKSNEELEAAQKVAMYGTKTGTSMSTPVVTGLIARMAQQYPSLSPENIVKAIKDSCNRGDPHLTGNGTIDFSKAFELAAKMEEFNTMTVHNIIDHLPEEVDSYVNHDLLGHTIDHAFV